MKKVIFAVVAIATLSSAGFTSYKVYENHRMSKFSNLMTKNLEALADDEDEICSFNRVIKNQDKHTLKCSGDGKQCCKFD